MSSIPNEHIMATIDDQFNAIDADVTFRSSDNVLFKLHRRNMLVTSGGFPGPEIDADGEIVPLEEPSAVLEHLFQFIYPERHTRLSELNDFAVLAQIAQAAQKYDVYTATDECENTFRAILPDHAIEILVYAIEHHNYKLVDASAVHLCRFPITDVIQVIPPRYAVPWVKYHEKCSKILFNKAERGCITFGDRNHPEYQINHFNELDLKCAMANLSFITSLKQGRNIVGIKGRIRAFMSQHMDTTPHHSHYNDVVDLDELCDISEATIDAISDGIEEAEKESFSSYYLANGNQG